MNSDNADCTSLPSIAVDLLTYCESKGLGKKGGDLFAHDFPNFKDTEQKHCVAFIETSPGTFANTLEGDITCQREFLSVFCKHKSEKDAREGLFPYLKELRKVVRVNIGKVHYMKVQALTPIHFVGKDKNDRFTCEVAFSVLRRPV